MGNKFGKVKGCFTGSIIIERPDNPPVYYSGSLDENDGLGHSFCYVRPDNPNEQQTTTTTTIKSTNTFRTISGASVSANTSTQPLSTSTLDLYYSLEKAASFDCTTSFTSVPLQPVPRAGSGCPVGPGSGPLFMSGPLERTFMSGPIDSASFQRSFSYAASTSYRRPRLLFLRRKVGIIGVLKRVVSRTMYRRSNQNSVVAPIKSGGKTADDWSDKNEMTVNSSSVNLCSEESLNDELGNECEGSNVQWAQGKAGEDRVHVVVSEERGWVFVGIYDGFNGPDAPDYLLSNLYANVHKELKGLLWDDRVASGEVGVVQAEDEEMDIPERKGADDKESCERDESIESKPVKRSMKYRGVAKKWEENQRRWRSEWDKERLELDRKLKEQLYWSRSSGSGATNHGDVLKALSQALKKTEEAFLEIADTMVMENPELALMGSCVLVMLMKREDVYVMNVGDSRAVLAQTNEPDYWLEKIGQDLESINEETMNDLEVSDGEKPPMTPSLNALQLSVDHSTSMEEEVQRIRNEHPDDPNAMVNDRVKGSLKVTRAFGAGYLKQPKWNNALLEVFRINYMGTSSYINCLPSLCHHRLGPRDKFLILSSDGLYQYFTNEEAVSEVELFISLQPDGDPAQHLVEEVLFRAANKAGMDFHELLEIPQGDRRRYHDDVSIIVISLEGRIWRSFV